jgi:hypothetical protein
MNRLIFFPFLFLYEIIISNPVKIVAIIVLSISLYTTYHCEEESIKKSKILSEFINSKGEYVYIYGGPDNYSNETYDNPQKLVNNILTYKEKSVIYSFSVAFFWISLIFLVIGFFVGLSDEDLSWHFENSWLTTFSTLIKCEYEEGKYYYTSLGRLIEIRDHRATTYNTNNLSRELRIYGFRELMNCPKFKTKTEDRNGKLDKLGI